MNIKEWETDTNFGWAWLVTEDNLPIQCALRAIRDEHDYLIEFTDEIDLDYLESHEGLCEHEAY